MAFPTDYRRSVLAPRWVELDRKSGGMPQLLLRLDFCDELCFYSDEMSMAHRREVFMSAYIFRSSRPSNWVSPRRPLDANERRLAYGPIHPMEGPGLITRLFGRH